MSTSYLSFTLKIQWYELRKFEQGAYNFNMKKAIEYLNILGCAICLQKYPENMIVVFCYSDLLNWHLANRKLSYTKSSFAKEIGRSHVSILNIETGKCSMSVDTFLKIAEIFKFNISVANV